MIVPKWQIEATNTINNDKLNMEFVRVSYDKVPDGEATPTDEDYKNFLNKNKGKYTTTEETRIIDYAMFNVLPTKADSLFIKSNLLTLKADFQISNK